MRSTSRLFGSTCVLALLLAGCSAIPSHSTPEKLVVYADGSMEFHDKPIPRKDVILYADGFGGEKAAVRVRMQPLHPDFFRDSIIVVRRAIPAADTEISQN